MKATVRTLLLAAACAGLGACTSEADSRFENPTLTAALIRLPATSDKAQGVAVNTLPGVDATGIVCVLPPYADRAEGDAAAAINEQLKAAGYRADEGRWALAQLPADGVLRMAVLRQRERRLAGVKSESGSGMCARPGEMFAIAGHDRELLFWIAAPKP
jgi:hypothetical protein